MFDLDPDSMAAYYFEQQLLYPEPSEYWGCDTAHHNQRGNGRQCKFCKHWGFEWKRLDDGTWRLHNGSSKVHECKAHGKAK